MRRRLRNSCPEECENGAPGRGRVLNLLASRVRLGKLGRSNAAPVQRLRICGGMKRR